MRMMISAFTFLMFSAVALAEPHHTKGIGVNTCAKFASDFRSDPSYYESYYEPVYFTWGQGYMSALNLRRPSDRHPMRDLSAVSTDEQMRAVRYHCDKHPLQIYRDAVLALYSTLPAIPG